MQNSAVRVTPWLFVALFFLLPLSGQAITLNGNQQCTGGTRVDTYTDIQDGGGVVSNTGGYLAAICDSMTGDGQCCNVSIQEIQGGTTIPDLIPMTYYTWTAYDGASLVDKQSSIISGRSNDTYYYYYAGIQGQTATAVTAGLVANPTNISPDEGSLLTWSSNGATECTGTGDGFETSGKPSGSIIVYPDTTTTYSVTCTNSASGLSDTDTATVTVSVSAPMGVSCAPDVSTAGVNQPVTWSATVTNAPGPVTYSWSGTDGLSGIAASVVKLYQTEGTKTARVRVTYTPSSAPVAPVTNPSNPASTSGTWQYETSDISDLACGAEGSGFIKSPANQTNVYSGMTICPTDNPTGMSCSPVGSRCKWNAWAGGTCNVDTNIYSCSVATGGTTTGTSPSTSGGTTPSPSGTTQPPSGGTTPFPSGTTQPPSGGGGGGGTEQQLVLGATCDVNDLDIALVLDVSASIVPAGFDSIKSAVNSFVNGFSSNTRFSLTTFARVASVNLAFTPSKTAITNAVNALGPIIGGTNYEDALIKARSTYDPRPATPNVVIFVSDGYPNRWGPNGVNGGGTNFEQAALDAAVVYSNALKASGARIITVGVSGVRGDPLETSLRTIASSGDYYPISSFSALGSALSTIAADVCGTPPPPPPPSNGPITIETDCNGLICTSPSCSTDGGGGGGGGGGGAGGGGGVVITGDTTCSDRRICIGTDVYQQREDCSQEFVESCPFGCALGQCIQPQAELTLTAFPSAIRKGETCRLTASATNVTSCRISGTGITSNLTVSGGTASPQSFTTPALQNSTTYTLSCNSPRGPVSVSTQCKIAALWREI